MAEPKEIPILDHIFTVSMPYDAGHVCSEAEAKVLNQTRRENLGNNFRKRVQAFIDGEIEKATIESLRAEFAELDSKYIFTLASAAAAVKYTPVEREARKIAREQVKNLLAQQTPAQKITEAPEGWTEEEWDNAIENQIAEFAANPEVVKIAEATIKARSKADGLALGSLSLNKAA